MGSAHDPKADAIHRDLFPLNELTERIAVTGEDSGDEAMIVHGPIVPRCPVTSDQSSFPPSPWSEGPSCPELSSLPAAPKLSSAAELSPGPELSSAAAGPAC